MLCTQSMHYMARARGAARNTTLASLSTWEESISFSVEKASCIHFGFPVAIDYVPFQRVCSPHYKHDPCTVLDL